MPGFEVFGEEERSAINDLFESNGGILFAHGFDAVRNGVFKVREFEAAICNKFQVSHAQAVSSGTAALHVALECLGVGRGDEVIIPSFTFVATAEAVLQSGADLVVVDIDDSLNIDPNAVKAAITPKTRAIMPVHMMGAPADMGRIVAIAKQFNLLVIEDAAQAVGGSFNGKALGTIGHCGCYSFDAGKIIITGEGGMVVTNNPDFFVKARGFHDHGHEYSTSLPRGQERAISPGFNYRMTELQGAIGIEQLKKLDYILFKQRSNKSMLKDSLKDLPFGFRRLNDADGELGDSLVIFFQDRKTTQNFLQGMSRQGLPTKNVPDAMRWHFAKHWNHIFKRHDKYSKSYESEWQVSADILECAVALPIMVKMDSDSIMKVSDKIRKISTEVF